jgi:hypothetical protein
MWRSFEKLVKFAMMLSVLCFITTYASAAVPGILGCAIAAISATSKPIDLVLEANGQGILSSVTVTHGNLTVIISPDNWQRDLDEYVSVVRADYGKTTPVIFTHAVSHEQLTDPTRFFKLVSSMERILERHGFRVDDGFPGYREPVSTGL